VNWEFLVRCERGHLIEVRGVLFNVDGRGEVRPPEQCEACHPKPRPKRVPRRKMRQMMKEFHEEVERFRWT
jgi:hypothetical protein